MTTWTCATCGPVPAGEIRHLDHNSPHGHEQHECGSSAGLDWTKKEHDMSTVDLDALNALLDAATTAMPWEVTALTFPDKFVITGDEEAYSVGTFWSLADADLIAALRNQAPALLAEIADLRQRLDAQTKAAFACQHEVNKLRARMAGQQATA